MQKFTLACSLCAIVAIGIGFSSCKDDEPFVKPNLSVETETITVNESAGTVEVEFVLDKGAPGDITIEYELRGTAISPADYTIVGTEGEVEIANGQTSGVVQIQIVSDVLYEGNETIQVSIEDVSSTDVVITSDDETVVTITDDDPQIKVSFSSPTLSLNESDNVLQVQVVLDKPAPTDVLIEYSLTGSARDSVTAVTANPDLPIDYAIAGTQPPGQLTIKAGQTTGTIRVRPYTDLSLEDADPETDPFDPESIIITIVDASNGIDFSTNNSAEISLEQQDGLLALLFWPDPAGTQQADMDMFLRVGSNITTWQGILTGSVAEDFESPELIFIPKNLSFAAYGLSYVYWDGTLDPLNFEVVFIDLVDGLLEGESTAESFTGTYTAANKNKWTDPATTQVVQTFKKVNGEFAEFSTISTPTTGSRIRPHAINSKLLRKIKAPQTARASFKTYRFQ